MRTISSILLFLSLALVSSGQNIKEDTVIVSKSEMDSCFGVSFHLTKQGNKYTYGDLDGHDKAISKKEYDYLTKYHNCFCDSILSENIFDKYVKIYNGKTLYEEGYWHPEWMGGAYKKFYKNGHKEEEGKYTEYRSPYGPGIKIGKWIYYNKNGNIKDTVTYYPPIDSTWRVRDTTIQY